MLAESAEVGSLGEVVRTASAGIEPIVPGTVRVLSKAIPWPVEDSPDAKGRDRKCKWLEPFLDLSVGNSPQDRFNAILSVRKPPEVKCCLLIWIRHREANHNSGAINGDAVVRVPRNSSHYCTAAGRPRRIASSSVRRRTIGISL